MEGTTDSIFLELRLGVWRQSGTFFVYISAGDDSGSSGDVGDIRFSTCVFVLF